MGFHPPPPLVGTYNVSAKVRAQLYLKRIPDELFQVVAYHTNIMQMCMPVDVNKCLLYADILDVCH